MKKILITGVNGFLGSNLTSSLKNDYKVYGIGRPGAVNIKKNCHKIIIKNLSIKNLKKNFRNIDYIIHCAGTGTVEESKKLNKFFELKSTKIVLDYINLYNPKAKLIYISSVAVYGDSYKNKINEKQKTNPISNYAKMKFLSENLCRNYSEKFNIPIVVLRISSLYGKGLKKQIIFDATKKIKSGNQIFYGTGKEVRDFLHVDDLMMLINKIIKRNLSFFEIYNCGSQQIYSIKSIISKLEKIIKKKINPIFNKSFVSSNPKSLKISTRKVTKKYNWHPKVKINDGLLDYYNWFQKEYD